MIIKKALLLIDRGSKEPDVKDELADICSMARATAGYHYASYCFLEVVPPFIEEGIANCIKSGADQITVMPYFLYPGLKLKDSVKKSARICKDKQLKMCISRPLCYHGILSQIVMDRIDEVKKDNGLNLDNSQCDIILIGHGSSDKNARDAFIHTADSLKPFYRNVNFCFLELDKPTIEDGISLAIKSNPRVLILMPYFLHRGVHIKQDVVNDIKMALQKHKFDNIFMARHIGVDKKIISLVVERAREVEKRFENHRQ